jgi:hypothetical protein
MTTKGKSWKWADNADGRAVLSKAMKARGLVGIPFKSKHGMGGTPTYNSWKKMVQRCTHPNNPDYKNYGGRGITVCERWLEDPRNFLEDMGERPPGKYSLERVDVNGNYEPGNCVWLEHRFQVYNRRPVEYTEERRAQLSEECSKRFKGRTRQGFTGKWNPIKEEI